MIALSHPRPASISVFAIAFFTDALIACVGGLFDIPARQAYLQTLIPVILWSRDAAIVWQSAWLSIALIPIAMVWLSAIRLARWMVTIMAVQKLLVVIVVFTQGWAVIAALSPVWLATSLLGPLAAAMLFTPASNRWFAREPELNPAIFE